VTEPTLAQTKFQPDEPESVRRPKLARLLEHLIAAEALLGGLYSFAEVTSTPVSQGGALGANTATIHFIQANKLIIGWVNCPLVNVGTGTGFVDIPLPVTPLTLGSNFPGVGAGKETGSTGHLLGGAVVPSVSKLRVSKYDGSTPIGVGANVLSLIFMYEAA
jgi:hypothetical protein